MPASYHDQWLFEGLVRYLGAMYIESKTGSSGFQEILSGARPQLLDDEKAGPIWLGQRLASAITPTGYRAVYSKGLWAIHMIRMMMRQDGPNPDARFLAMLRQFVDTYQGKTASTWDFKHLAEQYLNPVMDLRTDKKMDWFFDEWVFGMGIPSYALDYKVEASGSGFIIEGMIKQSGVPDGFVMSVPIYADEEYLGRVLVDGNEGEFRFRVIKKPERIVIDPGRTILRNESAG